MAATLPPEETLIISAEAGLLCLQGTEIDVAEVKTREELNQVLYDLGGKKLKYKYIFVDSLTEIGDMFLRELKDDPKFRHKNEQPNGISPNKYGKNQFSIQTNYEQITKIRRKFVHKSEFRRPF